MRVYKFLTAQWALDDLENKRLKIARFLELNDPFELLFSNMSDPHLRAALALQKLQMHLKRGLLCFSRKWSNPLLWSHYADKHTGICLGFDVQDECAMDVTYTENRLEITAEYLKALPEAEFKEIVKKWLWTKYKGWSYEEEVRQYVNLEEEVRDPATGFYFHLFDDVVKLREVITGPLCHDENVTKIEEAVEGFGEAIELIRGRLALGSFEVVRE